MMPSEQQECAKKHLPQPVRKLLTYPPPPQTGGITITTEDLPGLENEELLNDVILEFYLRYIFNEKLTPCQQEKTYLFTSFFFHRLLQRASMRAEGETISDLMIRRHKQVRKWTKNVDIFSKDFIIIPVNQYYHWFLVIVCYPGEVQEVPKVELKPACSESSSNESFPVERAPEFNNNKTKVVIRESTCSKEDTCLEKDKNNSTNSASLTCLKEKRPVADELSAETPDNATAAHGNKKNEKPCIYIFDSVHDRTSSGFFSVLREYLYVEWKTKKGTEKVFDENTMPGVAVKCPQQLNTTDCGPYLLHYVEKFFEDPVPYSNPMPDMTDWFPASEVASKRSQIKDLITNLSLKHHASAKSGPVQ